MCTWGAFPGLLDRDRRVWGHGSGVCRAAGLKQPSVTTTLREVPLDRVPMEGEHLVSKARTMPPEMSQILVAPHADTGSHFHARSLLMRRPRANFDTISEDGNSMRRSEEV